MEELVLTPVEQGKRRLAEEGIAAIEARDGGFVDVIAINKVGKKARFVNVSKMVTYFYTHDAIVDINKETVYIYKDGYYQEQTPADLKAWAQDIVYSALPECKDYSGLDVSDAEYAQRYLVTRQSSGWVDNFYKELLLRSPANVDLYSDKLKKKRQGVVPFKNGIFCVKRGFMPHSDKTKKYYFTYQLPYDYDADADCPTFRKFLFDICGDDVEQDEIQKQDHILKYECLQRFMGYTLFDSSYTIHKAAILIGGGSNGKSTFIDVFKAMVGKENYSTLNLKDLGSENARFRLKDKLLNISGETPKKALMDSSDFKELSAGGETSMRALYKNAVEEANTAKFMFACNEFPVNLDATEGLRRRLLVIKFNKNYSGSKRDYTIKEDVLQELSGIFNFALEGWKNILKDRKERKEAFPEIMDSKAELDEIISSAQSYTEKYFEDFEITKTGHEEDEINLTVHYQDFRKWSREVEGVNERFVQTNQKFTIDFKKYLAKKFGVSKKSLKLMSKRNIMTPNSTNNFIDFYKVLKGYKIDDIQG